ncbi:TetR/AcrR family transcriptional regulator [Actinomadura meyerae]|uniref:TetR/AcrR family transcriptional regulator n=1 Tax=Actinomadura meyerae TaxID=240840 RepID=UPI000B774E04|nr:TetR/AcrR family transcriptional regulator [Actinomadura meyerae]
MQSSGSGPAPRRLPRGRHALSRSEVERVHRDRLCAAMAAAMLEKGYVGTSVEDVLKRARVSRQSFYGLFSSKLDCFMAAFDKAGEVLMHRLEAAVGASTAAGGGEGDAATRFERAVTAYLDALSSEPGYARLFLVEVYAAGPEAIKRRADIQGALVGALTGLMGVTGPAGEFACKVIVAAVSSMVTPAIAMGDIEALKAIGPPVTEHVRVLVRSGVLDA